MIAPLTLEDILAATRAVAQIMDGVGGAVAAARLIRARAERVDAVGDQSSGRLSLAAAARIELERRRDAGPRCLDQRRLLLAAAAVCTVMAAAP